MPIWWQKKEKPNNELTEIKGDKYAIGGYQSEKRRKYTNHSLTLNEGDAVYICTDGYSDQFGGLNSKKFMSRQLKELLLRIHKESMPEQKQILNNAFEAWKGKEEQVDDILVIGVRV